MASFNTQSKGSIRIWETGDIFSYAEQVSGTCAKPWNPYLWRENPQKLAEVVDQDDVARGTAAGHGKLLAVL
jgi:hypothetical protein